MHRSTAVRLAALVPVALLLVPLTGSWPAPTELGAPWIALETPANPLDAATRHAAFVVRVYYHETPADLPVSGTAEGLVDGKRQSVPLEFTPTGKRGVYALRQQWPASGHWMLAVRVADGRFANLIVELGPNGGIADARYFEARAKAVALHSVRVERQPPDAAAISATLQAMARQTVASRPDR